MPVVTAALVLLAALAVAVAVAISAPAAEGDDPEGFVRALRTDPELPGASALLLAALAALGAFTFVAFASPFPNADILLLALLAFFAAPDLRRGLVPVWAAPALLWFVLVAAVGGYGRLAPASAIIWGFGAWVVVGGLRAIAMMTGRRQALAGGDAPIVVALGAYLGPLLPIALAVAALAALGRHSAARVRFLPFLWFAVAVVCCLPATIAARFLPA